MVVPAIVLVVPSRRVVAVVSGNLHSIVVMVMLVDGDGIADVADLVRVPGSRRCRHAERHHDEGEQVPEKTKSVPHGEWP